MSLRPILRLPPAQRGVTLIEVMIVVAVFGLMVATVVLGFGAGRSAEVSRAVNQLANTIRYGYDKAKVTGDHYRLLVSLEDSSFTLQQGDDRMYLPATDRDGRPTLLDESEQEERDARDKAAAESYYRSVQSAVYEQDTGGPADPYAVQANEVPRRRPPLFESFEDENALSGLVEPIKLPEGMKIVAFRTAEDPETITAGEGALYFFPRGQTQLASIQIKDEESDVAYTIEVQPLTGRVKVEEGLHDLELPRDRRDQEDDLGNRGTRRSF